MIRKIWLAALASTATLGLAALPAQSAPMSVGQAVASPAASTANVQPVYWRGRGYHYRHYRWYGPRRHYWHRGYWHHRHHRHW